MHKRLNTDEYLRSHGREPAGRATWLLRALVRAGERGYTHLGPVSFRGTPREGLTWMARKARAEIGGADWIEVSVLP